MHARPLPPAGRRDAGRCRRRVVACLLSLTAACCAPPPAPTDEGASITIGVPGVDIRLDALVFGLTQTRMVRLDQSGEVRPGLIDRWSVSDDLLEWTLHVREGVELSDGRSATAEDVVDRMRAVVRDGGLPGFWGVRDVSTPRPFEVRVRLDAPNSLLLDSLGLVEATAGPYAEVSADAATLELRAVRQQGEPDPDVQRVRTRRYDTPRAAVAALLRDEVDALLEVPAEVQTLLATEPAVRTFPHVKPYAVTLGLNHAHPVLAQRDVRLALNLAVDRETLIAQAAGGIGVPAADLIWHQHWSAPHGGDAALLRVDRPRAERLLDAAGLRRRTSPDGAITPRFRITCLVLDNPMMRRIAGRLQQTYADIGVALDLEVVPLPRLQARLPKGDFETFLSPVVTGYGLDLTYLHFAAHDRPRVFAHGYTAAADAAEAVRVAPTRDALVQATHALHAVLIENPPAVALFWQETSRAVGRRIIVPPDPAGDVLLSLPRWRVRSVTP